MPNVLTGTFNRSSKIGPKLHSEPISANKSTPSLQSIFCNCSTILLSISSGLHSNGISKANKVTLLALYNLRATFTIELAVYSPCIATAITIFRELSSCFNDCNNIAKYSVSDFDTVTSYFSSIINFIFVANLNSIELLSTVPSSK